ncbi:sulfite exporter TauE/SafE family protein [Candidatus Uhrbacteria bacterium]|nr:sulfite exporter TauE/SafE family protein [Candidatus Uhrbacteria bacterium]
MILENDLIFFIIVGFAAQMIDGALGMAYGISASSLLLAMGTPPAITSASVHFAEIFTTFVSAISHFKFKNIDKQLFKKLLVPGMAGGAFGAVVLTLVSGRFLKFAVTVYLFCMGLFILYKAFKIIKTKPVHTKIAPIGFLGGFLDAVGGGGWGPIVGSTLTARGNNPRFAVGSTNAVEFFVSLTIVVILTPIVGITHWQVVAGLLIGGVLAAPFAAYVCKRMPPRHTMIIVSVLISVLSVKTFYDLFR